MEIVTFAGTGGPVAGWPSYVVAPFRGVACEPQGLFPQSTRLRQRDLDLPTDPQRPSAPRRWSP
jgi:hypothetical protein